jgi:hypothetical protein
MDEVGEGHWMSGTANPFFFSSSKTAVQPQPRKRPSDLSACLCV